MILAQILKVSIFKVSVIPYARFFSPSLRVWRGEGRVFAPEPGERVRPDGAGAGGGAGGRRAADGGFVPRGGGVLRAAAGAEGGPPAEERRVGARLERGAEALLFRHRGADGHRRYLPAGPLRETVARAAGVSGCGGGERLDR